MGGKTRGSSGAAYENVRAARRRGRWGANGLSRRTKSGRTAQAANNGARGPHRDVLRPEQLVACMQRRRVSFFSDFEAVAPESIARTSPAKETQDLEKLIKGEHHEKMKGTNVETALEACPHNGVKFASYCVTDLSGEAWFS